MSELDGYTEDEKQRAIRSLLWKRQYNVEYNRRYALDHRVEIAEYKRRRYQEHRDQILEYTRRYAREHLEAYRIHRQKRRAAIRGSDGCFTVAEFRLLCEVCENRCFYCGEVLPLGPDHVVPLSKGGGNGIENIVPSCAICNKRKGTRSFDEFVEELGGLGGSCDG